MAHPPGAKNRFLMEGLVGTGLTVLGSVLTGVVGAWFLFRGKKVESETAETQAQAAATAAFLEGQVEFQEYVEGVVALRVDKAVAGLQAQLTELAAKLAGVQGEFHEMTDAIRSRETRLWLWNIQNRNGPMPELPMPVLEKLNIGHLAASSAE